MFVYYSFQYASAEMHRNENLVLSYVQKNNLAVLTLPLPVMYVIAELVVVTNSEEDGSKNGGGEDASISISMLTKTVMTCLYIAVSLRVHFYSRKFTVQVALFQKSPSSQ